MKENPNCENGVNDAPNDSKKPTKGKLKEHTVRLVCTTPVNAVAFTTLLRSTRKLFKSGSIRGTTSVKAIFASRN